MTRNTIKSFVAGDDLNKKIATEAAKRNISVSKYLKEAMKLYLSLDQEKLERITKISNFLDLEVPEVVNSMLKNELDKILTESKCQKKEESC